jgi:hypothetical protein
MSFVLKNMDMKFVESLKECNNQEDKRQRFLHSSLLAVVLMLVTTEVQHRLGHCYG